MIDVTSRAATDGIDTSRNVYDVLEERGFIGQSSDGPGLREALADPVEPPITAYSGFDPTASSLHVGNLLSIMLLAHMQRHGHRPIALIGGGTGMIGDPTDKSATRPILTLEQIEQNIAGDAPAVRALPRFRGRAFRGQSARAAGEQCRLAVAAALHRVPARHRQAFQRQPVARATRPTGTGWRAGA